MKCKIPDIYYISIRISVGLLLKINGPGIVVAQKLRRLFCQDVINVKPHKIHK